MYLDYQQSALDELKVLAEKDCHSILISGIRGSGKTYIASRFAAMIESEIFQTVSCKVADLKAIIETSYKINAKQVICIENLDEGQIAAAQVILKYLEEPLPYVYVVVTCINPASLPSTILSRSIQVVLSNPNFDGLKKYGKNLNKVKFEVVEQQQVFNICKSLTDVELMINLTSDQLRYFDKFLTKDFWKQSVDQISWALNHYADNSKCNPKWSLLFLHKYGISQKIKDAAISCLLDLESGTLSESAILGKFVIESR